MKISFGFAVAALLASGSASAAITVTSQPGTDPYSGPAPTYDFETDAPAFGGAIRSGDAPGIAARPLGSTGNFWTVGPSDGSPGTMDLTAFSSISQISFLWGSIDGYNLLEILGPTGLTLASFAGSDIFNPADGNQASSDSNRLVFLNFSGSSALDVKGLRLSSSQNAFETDNFAIRGIGAVPEPATWALFILGFGMVGGAMRARAKKAASARTHLSFV